MELSVMKSGPSQFAGLDGLVNMLKAFLPEGCGQAADPEQPSNSDSTAEVSSCGQIQCEYCGNTSDNAPITLGAFHEYLCLDCSRELVWQTDICGQIIEETIHNLEHLFAMSWGRYREIQLCVRLKPANSIKMPDESAIQHSRYVWTAGIRPEIVQAKISRKHKTCVFQVRTGSPASTIITEVVYAVLEDYLRTAKETVSAKLVKGLAAWYTVHYLYCMDYGRFGDYYDEKLTDQKVEEIAVYKLLGGKETARNGEIKPLKWGIQQVSLMRNSGGSDKDASSSE